jgi:hypothetical protein
VAAMHSSPPGYEKVSIMDLCCNYFPFADEKYLITNLIIISNYHSNSGSWTKQFQIERQIVSYI